MIRMIVTVGGVGLLKPAPGTWGSAVAIPVTYALHVIGGAGLVIAMTFALFGIGYWASHAYLSGRHEDPSEIVIDEVVGQLIALWPLSIGLWLMDHPSHIFPWPGVVGGFILFRLFDIWKPWPIRAFDRPGAVWIMLDDVAAGIAAALVIFVSAGVSHGWF